MKAKVTVILSLVSLVAAAAVVAPAFAERDRGNGNEGQPGTANDGAIRGQLGS